MLRRWNHRFDIVDRRSSSSITTDSWIRIIIEAVSAVKLGSCSTRHIGRWLTKVIMNVSESRRLMNELMLLLLRGLPDQWGLGQWRL